MNKLIKKSYSRNTINSLYQETFEYCVGQWGTLNLKGKEPLV